MDRYINLRDLNEEKTNNGEIAVIKAPVGYGKTYFAANVLSKTVDDGMPFMLVPTKAIKWQTINDYNNAIWLDNFDLRVSNPERRMRVACFSAIAAWLAEGKEIKNKPELLILDEIDELAKWSMCFEGYLLAWDWILTNSKDIKVIGLSATPELLTDYMRDIKFTNIARELKPKYKANKVEVIQHSSVITYLKTVVYSENSKVLVYLQSAKQCAEMASKYPHAGFIISEYNTDEIEGKELRELMNEQLVNDFHNEETNLREYVLNNHRLPHGYNLLFFNDSCHTGMNIKDESVKHVICESVEQAAIIQAIGRVRHDLDKVTVITNNKNKKPFFKNLERAKGFFLNPMFGDYGYLCGFHQEEQSQIDNAKKKKERLDFDILTYEDSEGTVKVNPFAQACYEYVFDIYRKLEKSWTAREYFDEMLKPLAMTGNVIYISADEVKAAATNAARFDEDIIEGFLDKDLFSADRKRLASLVNLVDKQRRARGWTSLKRYLVASGYQVCESKRINPETGKRENYSRISKVHAES